MHLGRYIHGILTFVLWRVYNLENLVPSGCSITHPDELILTLERHADDHEGLWPSGGAGLHMNPLIRRSEERRVAHYSNSRDSVDLRRQCTGRTQDRPFCS